MAGDQPVAHQERGHAQRRWYGGTNGHTARHAIGDNRRDGLSGFGLGLAISQKIINAHNGNLKIKSELNKGTKFVINIPI